MRSSPTKDDHLDKLLTQGPYDRGAGAAQLDSAPLSPMVQDLPTSDGERVLKAAVRPQALRPSELWLPGMASSCVVRQKGVGDCPIAELRKFVMECGESQSVLQTDQEASIRALARGLATFTRLSAREAPPVVGVAREH